MHPLNRIATVNPASVSRLKKLRIGGKPEVECSTHDLRQARTILIFHLCSSTNPRFPQLLHSNSCPVYSTEPVCSWQFSWRTVFRGRAWLEPCRQGIQRREGASKGSRTLHL